MPTNHPAPSVARDRVTLYGAAASTDADLLAACMIPAIAKTIAASGLSSIVTGKMTGEIPEQHRSAIDAFLELSRRVAVMQHPFTSGMIGPDDAARFCRNQWGGEPVEVFAVIGLDAKLKVKMVRVVARGSISHVDVHPREVFAPLIESRCHSAIVTHNHPSGDATPSAADIQLTQRLAEVGRMVGIPVVDHLVVTRSTHTSLAAMGIIGGR